MKIRMQFAKYGSMAYIGHLDVMRYFQKALRRAKVELVFTQGFSPHPVLSFASPLGVGAESIGEYADLEVDQTDSTAAMLERLNAAMVPGIEVLDWRLLPDNAPNAMSSVSAADYQVSFRKGIFEEKFGDIAAFTEGFEDFLKQDQILAEKETKKGSKLLDIKPLILEYAVKTDEETREPLCFFRVSAGSAGNLKPELILMAYAKEKATDISRDALRIVRLETYCLMGEEGKERLVPLREAGNVIET